MPVPNQMHILPNRIPSKLTYSCLLTPLPSPLLFPPTSPPFSTPLLCRRPSNKCLPNPLPCLSYLPLFNVFPIKYSHIHLLHWPYPFPPPTSTILVLSLHIQYIFNLYFEPLLLVTRPSKLFPSSFPSLSIISLPSSDVATRNEVGGKSLHSAVYRIIQRRLPEAIAL